MPLTFCCDPIHFYQSGQTLGVVWSSVSVGGWGGGSAAASSDFFSPLSPGGKSSSVCLWSNTRGPNTAPTFTCTVSKVTDPSDEQQLQVDSPAGSSSLWRCTTERLVLFCFLWQQNHWLHSGHVVCVFVLNKRLNGNVSIPIPQSNNVTLTHKNHTTIIP